MKHFLRDYKSALIGVTFILVLLFVAGMAQAAESDQSIPVAPPEKVYHITESQMRALYEEYRETRKDNLMLLDMVETLREKVQELKSSKNCS